MAQLQEQCLCSRNELCLDDVFSFLLADCICLLHFVCQIRDCWNQFFKNTPKTVFKICLKINLVEFFSFKVYFLPLKQPVFLSKHPNINSLFIKISQVWKQVSILNTLQMKMVCENTVKIASFNPVWRHFKVLVISNHNLNRPLPSSNLV